MPDPTKLSVTIGEPERDYAIGDYLNAIDEITCYFAAHRDSAQIAAALRLYADGLGGE